MNDVVSFDSEKAVRYLNEVFAGYLNDPADSDHQRGFLACALTMYQECLNRGHEDARIGLLEAQLRG